VKFVQFYVDLIILMFIEDVCFSF